MQSLPRSVRALHLSLLVTIVGIGGAAAAVQVAEVSETLESRYGSHIDAEGWVHFVVYSPHADQVHLLLFDQPADKIPAQTIPMQRHGEDWQVKIRGQGVGAGLLYMYQAKGPHEVSQDDQYGLMFNEHFYLNDPYCQKTENVAFSAFFASTPFTDITAPVYAGGGKCTVYDHSQDISPSHVHLKPEDLIIYELHVQDYTARIEGLERQLRGTYAGLAVGGLKTPAGLAAGLDHLVELGITAVELMPVMATPCGTASSSTTVTVRTTAGTAAATRTCGASGRSSS